MRSNPIALLIGLLLGFAFYPNRLSAAEGDAPAAPGDAASSKSWAREFLERDYLLGNWGGLRTNLSNRGIDFEFFYLGSVPSNAEGGIKSGSVYQGALLMSLD